MQPRRPQQLHTLGGQVAQLFPTGRGISGLVQEGRVQGQWGGSEHRDKRRSTQYYPLSLSNHFIFNSYIHAQTQP